MALLKECERFYARLVYKHHTSTGVSAQDVSQDRASNKHLDQQTKERSTVMSNWEHLFLKGEFPERVHLLSGLTLEQVTLRPEGASHSIYEELWHASGYQCSVVEHAPATGDYYPSAAPEHEQQWHDLVQQFLKGAQAAVALAQAPDQLAVEVEPGVTMADELNSVAVHNAYHLGKIVALRQRIGAWPPTKASDAS